jgi:hypothetical protein
VGGDTDLGGFLAETLVQLGPNVVDKLRLATTGPDADERRNVRRLPLGHPCRRLAARAVTGQEEDRRPDAGHGRTDGGGGPRDSFHIGREV